MSYTRGKRVVIVGAGFGGLWAARALAGTGAEVLVLDRNNFHTFLPLLYQVAAAELSPTDICYPVRSIFRKEKGIQFRLGTVGDLDPVERLVMTNEERIPYDYLILAMGSAPHFFGIPGAEEHAFAMKSIDQAVPLRHHILTRFEAAVYERDPARRRQLRTITIVGGGPTGVEFAGALAELVYGPLQEDYPMLDLADVRIILLEAQDRLLSGMPLPLGRYVRSRLERRAVRVRFGAQVTRITEGEVFLSDGSVIRTETVVWTAGVKGETGPERWGLPMERGGRVAVESTLNVPGFPEVYVVGDLAYLEEKGEPLPGVAPVAMQQGELAAKNILRHMKGEAGKAFRFKDPGMLAVVGRGHAVAHIGGRSFTGIIAWWVWLVVHVAKLVGFRNRILVMVNWAWNYLSFERAVRLILPYQPPRSSGEVSPEAPGSVVRAPGPDGSVPAPDPSVSLAPSSPLPEAPVDGSASASSTSRRT
jgi:NADH:ubiquinone reductase (H+-translocating)